MSSPWTQMGTNAPAPASPEPSGTARDYANMLNQHLTKKKKKHGC